MSKNNANSSKPSSSKPSSSKPSTPMTPSDASRIQSHADRTGTNQGFKAAAQSAAAKNSGKK